MDVKDIVYFIEKHYPKHLAYDWDNVGLLIGDSKRNVKKILLTLEATDKVIDEAISKNIDMIITHHPFLFKGIKDITTDTYKGKCIYNLIKNDISLYSMHTNFDIGKNGLNDYFCDLIGLKSLKILDKTYDDGITKEGLGRIGKFEKDYSLEEIGYILKEKFKLSNLRFVGDEKAIIHKVAVVTGSGADLMHKASFNGANLLITGDMKYHDAQTVLELDMCAIDIGHFESENIFIDVMYSFLCDFDSSIEIIKSNININPFKAL